MTTEQLKKTIQAALPECAELEGYRANRVRDAALPYVPTYHFTAPGGYLNDPCGYCYFKGIYHLFYQFIPEGSDDLCWGHAVSADNLHWLDLPIAFAPELELMCCSGGTLVEEDRVIACYSGNLRTDPDNNYIHVLVSRDDLLLRWERTSALPTLCTLREDGSLNEYNAFDPCLFKDGEDYCMLTAGGGSLPHPYNLENLTFRRHFLFTSHDLVNWEYRHTFVEDDVYCVTGDDGACPYFLPIGEDRHILLHFSHRQGGKYIVGDYCSDEKKFHAKNGGAFNAHGWFSGVHAPSAYADGNGGVDVIFNVNYGYKTPGQNMVMSLPRKLTVNPDYSINESPTGELASLRGAHLSGTLTAPANTETLLDGISGNALELKLRIDTARKKQARNFVPDDLIPMVELRVLRSPDCSEYTAIRFFRNRGAMDWGLYKNEPMHWANGAESVLEVDTSYSTLSPDVAIHPTEHQSFTLRHDEPIDLHVFVDKSIVEVFANGKKCISVRVYPTRPDSQTLSLLSRGVDVQVSFDAWHLRPIGDV